MPIQKIQFKFQQLYSGLKKVCGKSSKTVSPNAAVQLPTEASLDVFTKRVTNTGNDGRTKLSQQIKELVEGIPSMPDELLEKPEVKKLMQERAKHVKDYEVAFYPDIYLNADLYKRQMDYLGIDEPFVSREVKLNYDLAYWKAQFAKYKEALEHTQIIETLKMMNEEGIKERKLSDAETLMAKYLDELKILKNSEARIKRIKEIDAKLVEIIENFKNKA